MQDTNKRIADPEIAFQCCKEIADSIKENVLRTVALEILKENKHNLLNIKGSDWHHHNYAGGLVVHLCNVTLTSVSLANFYNDRVCMDLVKFCALMHDVGKLFDYKPQSEFPNSNDTSMNQALLGHSLEGVVYVSNKLRAEYKKQNVPEDYIDKVIIQVSHCIGAHMIGYGACSKQKMFEVVIIGKADQIDACLEGTIVKDHGEYFDTRDGEIFYRSIIYNSDN